METTATGKDGLRLRISRLLDGKGVLRAMLSGVATVAALTLVAKAASFFKDAAVAHRFGTADSLDAFLLSFSFLTFLAAVVGGGLPEAFLPAYAELNHKRGLRRAQRLGVQATVWNVITLGVIATFLFFAAPGIIEFTGRGFSVEKRMLSIETLRSLLPFLIFYGLTFHFSTWLRAEKCFALATTAPLLPPVMIIFCLLSAGSNASVQVLVVGTNVGVFLQLIVLFLALRRRMVPQKGSCLRLWEPANKIVLGNAIPYLLGGLIMNSAVIIDQAMAAWLEPGSVSTLSYADKVCGIVLALSATAASEAVFPFFAETVARREWQLVKRQLLQVTGAILLVAMPLVVGLIVFAPQIVGALFERGSFTSADTAKVAGVLRFTAMQIPFYIAGVLASRVAVSMQATRFTLVASIGAMGCNIVFNALLMRHMGVAGIALSTALVHLLSAVALYVYIFRRLKKQGPQNGRERA
jgi:putative peptidoglycan lipid II flippase